MIKIIYRFEILHDYCTRIILNGESTISFSRVTKKKHVERKSNILILHIIIVIFVSYIHIRSIKKQTTRRSRNLT